MRPDEPDLATLLSAGLLAPSAENCHYLRFATAAHSVDLVSTDHASWSNLPHRKMLGLLAFGAVIENIAIASLPLGLRLSVETWPEPDHPERIARLRWDASSSQAVDPLVNALAQRHTNRRFYQRARLDPTVLAGLAAAAGKVPDAALRWLDEPKDRAAALHVIRLAETERFKRPRLHAELFGAVRFELGWHRSSGDWLPPGALEVEPPMRPVFAQLRHWPLMRAVTWFGGHTLLGLRAGYLPCATAPHLGLIVAGADAEPLANLSAGRALQRAWLAAANAGVAFQPMAAAPALARQRPGEGWVSEATRDALRRGLDGLTPPDGKSRPYMLFRVGLATAPRLRTGRLPLDHHRA